MGKRKYPPLTPGEVVAILLKSGFTLKRTHGDHAHYERLRSESDPLRRIVTVDTGAKDFSDTLVKSMIEQSGLGRSKFYGATKRTAAKAGVKFLRVSNEAEGE
jgi:predicted RNA binding protein YcfA (HicA-like mRNA interferase family)